LRCWHHTTFLFAIPMVTIFGDVIVNRVRNKLWEYLQDVKQIVQTSKFIYYLQCCFCFVKIGFAGFIKHDTVGMLTIDADMIQNLITQIRLQRYKTKYIFGITFNDKLHRGIAKITNPVKEYDFLVFG